VGNKESGDDDKVNRVVLLQVTTTLWYVAHFYDVRAMFLEFSEKEHRVQRSECCVLCTFYDVCFTRETRVDSGHTDIRSYLVHIRGTCKQMYHIHISTSPTKIEKFSHIRVCGDK